MDRLSDLGDEPPPAATPVEVAAATDDAMLPLARVYGESIYGPPLGRAFDLEHVVAGHPVARGHRGAPRRPLLAGPPPGLAWYRLRSLAPRRWRLRRRPR